jgi:hypothetical protein
MRFFDPLCLRNWQWQLAWMQAPDPGQRAVRKERISWFSSFRLSSDVEKSRRYATLSAETLVTVK